MSKNHDYGIGEKQGSIDQMFILLGGAVTATAETERQFCLKSFIKLLYIELHNKEHLQQANSESSSGSEEGAEAVLSLNSVVVKHLLERLATQTQIDQRQAQLIFMALQEIVTNEFVSAKPIIMNTVDIKVPRRLTPLLLSVWRHPEHASRLSGYVDQTKYEVLTALFNFFTELTHEFNIDSNEYQHWLQPVTQAMVDYTAEFSSLVLYEREHTQHSYSSMKKIAATAPSSPKKNLASQVQPNMFARMKNHWQTKSPLWKIFVGGFIALGVLTISLGLLFPALTIATPLLSIAFSLTLLMTLLSAAVATVILINHVMQLCSNKSHVPTTAAPSTAPAKTTHNSAKQLPTAKVKVSSNHSGFFGGLGRILGFNRHHKANTSPKGSSSPKPYGSDCVTQMFHK